jgi:hypothetical protein
MNLRSKLIEALRIENIELIKFYLDQGADYDSLEVTCTAWNKLVIKATATN